MTPPARSGVATQAPYPIGFSTKIGYYLAPLVLMTVDYVVIVAALLTAWFIRVSIVPQYFTSLMPFDIQGILLYVVIPSNYISFLAYEGLYSKRLPFWQCAEKVFKICTYVSLFAIMVMYFVGTAEQVSRLFVAFTWIISFVYLCIARYFVKKGLTATGLWQKPVVIVGAGKTAEILAQTFTDEPSMGYKIVGVVEDNLAERPLVHRYPHIGTFATVEQAVKSSEVQDVIIAAPGLQREELLDLVYRIQPYVRNLTIVPDLFGVPLSNMSVETLFNEKIVLLKSRNNLSLIRNFLIKRCFDIVAGSIICVMILPILIVLAIKIKADSSGPIMHNAKRLGRNGQEFSCYKFRTMHVNGDSMLQDYFKENPSAKEEWDKFAKLKDYDPRVTKAGMLLRRYSLDELPQIINVLKGEMSLVGPRPYLPREKERMSYYANTILDTVPGITGLWQVSGRNEITFEGRLELDVWYVRNWSFWQDIVLLFKTIGVVMGRKGAY
ncbi:MAG: Undecaprenyl-phosphate galactose phosphotransferase, WbaP [Firmicutes bacterium]|nr:Undecaprenyl-phosphate galactose phosphotransferase, WbaP [Bacillota bacterium]